MTYPIEIPGIVGQTLTEADWKRARRLGLKVVRRFAKKVEEQANGCWTWTGCRVPRGYGQFYPTTGRMVYAHRFAWMLFGGAIPNKKLVLHHCDSPPCVCPQHLFIGSHKDNLMDAFAKGRHRPPITERGERHPSAKLSDEDVARIRDRLQLGHRQVDIAADFGVTQTRISQIKRGHRS